MEAPKLPSIFKHRGPKSFEFKPRYYDARKERLEELKKKYNGANPPLSGSAGFRDKIQSQWHSDRSRTVQSSNIRLVVIIAILVLLTYLIISY